MPESPLLSIQYLPPTPSHNPKPQGPFDIEGPSVYLYCSPYWTGEEGRDCERSCWMCRARRGAGTCKKYIYNK